MYVSGPKEDAETIEDPSAGAGKIVSSAERKSPSDRDGGTPQPVSSRQSHTTAGALPVEVLFEPPAEVGEPLDVDDDPAWLAAAEDEDAAEIGSELAAEDPLSLEPAASSEAPVELGEPLDADEVEVPQESGDAAEPVRIGQDLDADDHSGWDSHRVLDTPVEIGPALSADAPRLD
jgi:hypothetical protein